MSKLTKIIDQYINGELNAEDLKVFESRLATNSELQAEVELQQLTVAMIERNALRSIIEKTGKSYHLKRNLIKAGIALAIASTLVGLGIYFFRNSSSETEQTNETAIAELSEEEIIIEKVQEYLAFDQIKPQYFEFDGEDDVFLTESGVLMSVTENSFLLNDQPYHGKAMIQWQETVDPADFMKAGLSTRAGDRLLETQGMFNISAFTPEGEKLELTREGVYVQVPVDSIKTGMMLFPGEMLDNGDVDWKIPVELDHLPTQKPMSEINLFPTDFINTLDTLKWHQEKEKRDSLYLSFEPIDIPPSDTTSNELEDWTVKGRGISSTVNPGGILTTHHFVFTLGNGEEISFTKNGLTEREAQSFAARTADSLDLVAKWKHSMELERIEINRFYANMFIHPSKILSIWKEEYDNTILATKEFEDRIQAIHHTCNNNVLDAYINNLDKAMWEIDEMVAKMGYSQFQQFANDRVGKIEIDNKHQQNLNKFYQTSVKQLQEKGKENARIALERERKWDEETYKIRSEYQVKQSALKAKNQEKEYHHNLRSVYRQMGKTVGFTINDLMNVEPKSPYGTVVNIDRYVEEATAVRQSGTFTDPFTGKTGSIEYKEFTATCNNHSDYNKLYIYFCPKELNSYERIDFNQGQLNYSLNQEFGYSGVVIGINADGYFYQEIGNITAQDFGEINLEQLSEQELDKRINAFNKNVVSRSLDLSTELKWIFREKQDYEIQERRKSDLEFRRTIGWTISRCWGRYLEQQSIEEIDDYQSYGIREVW